MVREVRFSIPADQPELAHRELFDKTFDDLDELLGDDDLAPPPRGRVRDKRQKGPIDRRADHRHLAGGDWLTDADFVEEA